MWSTSSDGEDEQERRRRLELLRDSYDEVLDAVKHQDDKIGRLLTGLSFLTAATLAVAGLGSAQYVTRRFAIAPWGDVPLALVFLGLFVVGVIVAVSLLLAAFSTPLRRSDHSTLYFFGIALYGKARWRAVTDESIPDLERRRVRELVIETHNLASRAKYKYERVSEATAILMTSMLALILASALTLIAAGSPCDPAAEPGTPCTAAISLGQTTTAVLGVIVMVTILVKYQSVIRNQRQTRDELGNISVLRFGRRRAEVPHATPEVPNVAEGEWVSAWCTAVVAGLLVGTSSVDGSHGWGVRAIIVTLVLVTAVLQARRLFHARRALDKVKTAVADPKDHRVKDALRTARSVCTVQVTTVALGVFSIAAVLFEPYGARLVVGVGIYGVLGLSEFVRSLLKARRERIDAAEPESANLAAERSVGS
jgi:hypothetical protein